MKWMRESDEVAMSSPGGGACLVLASRRRVGGPEAAGGAGAGPSRGCEGLQVCGDLVTLEGGRDQMGG